MDNPFNRTSIVTFNHRRQPRRGWSRDALRAAVFDGGDEGFELKVLEQVDARRAHCDCCGRLFTAPDQVAAVSIGWNETLLADRPSCIVSAYCVLCVATHGFELLDEQAKERLLQERA